MAVGPEAQEVIAIYYPVGYLLMCMYDHGRRYLGTSAKVGFRS